MRVGFWGNICNNFYGICKAIKQSDSELDCHLYIPDNADIQNLPESEDAELTNNYPNWIHKSYKWDPELFFKKFDRSLVKELSKYDVVILSGRGISLSPYIKAKVIFYITGGDLTIAPYYNRNMFPSKSKVAILMFKIAAFFQKRGIRKADEIWGPPFSPFKSSLDDLKIKPSKIKTKFFPLIIDEKKIKYRKDDEFVVSQKIVSEFRKYRFTIFHPSRIIMGKTDFLVKSGQWKHNDLLLHGFKRFVDQTGITDAGIIVIDRYANDFEKSEFIKIAEKLGISQYITWIKADHPQGFMKNEMLDLYSLADLVVDEFGIGWFGSIVLEAAACSKPVMCYVDDTVMKELYPWHPIISVNTEEDIAEKISELYSKPQLRLEIGEKSRQWIKTFHSPDQAPKLYLKEIMGLIEGNG